MTRIVAGLPVATAMTWLLSTLATAAPAAACSVCFGGADNAFVQGSAWSMLFMLALTYGVIGGGVLMAVIVRRRSTDGDDDGSHLRLVHSARSIEPADATGSIEPTESSGSTATGTVDREDG